MSNPVLLLLLLLCTCFPVRALFLERLLTWGRGHDDCAGACSLSAACWLTGGQVSARGRCANLFESCCLRTRQELAEEGRRAAALAAAAVAQPRRLDFALAEVSNDLEDFQVSILHVCCST